MSDIILERRDDGVAILTLNAPQRRNSLTLEMAREISNACDAVDRDDSIGATIVRATGPVFCAGADRELLARVGEQPASNESYLGLMEIYAAFGRINRLSMPTITAVQGTALGAGLNLALSADLCLVADSARLLSGFIPIGAHPGGGHFTLLSRRAGPQLAAAMGLFGHELVGSEAVNAGLAFECCTSTELDERALELAVVAAADPALSRRVAESFRMQINSPQAQQEGTRIEQAAQMWSLHRRTKR